MGDILRRRQMMKIARGGGGGPLYQLLQGALSTGSRAISVSGNTITDLRSGGGGNTRNRYISGTSFTTAVQTDTWFNLASGDLLTLKLKNITYSYQNTYTNPFQIALRDGTNESIVSAILNPAANTSGTIADVTKTATLTGNKTATCFWLYAYGTQTFEYDLELWVNDTRYI